MKDMAHQFLDWLRSKPADGEYNYDDVPNCAIAQFLRDNGYAKDPRPGLQTWADYAATPFVVHDMPRHFIGAVRPKDGGSTFHAAADRLEKLLQP